ncbi:MAG: choloylglycine hydrolase [Christensenellales bacterium]
MCTATTYKTKDFYFGRTLDYEFSYGDEIAVMPRKYPLNFRYAPKLREHYAIIGMAHNAGGFPLFYDAMNEKGLCIAGLNFVGNAKYSKPQSGKDNVAQYELIPWLLSQCASVKDARGLLKNLNITDDAFSCELPVAQLHWLVADKDDCITLECVKDGLKIYDNPVGVLTNNPPFETQLFNLNNYMGLSAGQAENRFGAQLPLETYSRGMGALGLPGDLSSASRFVRAAFTRANSRSGESEQESVNQFFHLLGSVEQQRGCCEVGEGKYEITIYTSCCNASKGIYYYTTYENSRICAVDMHKENLDGTKTVFYPPVTEWQVLRQN